MVVLKTVNGFDLNVGDGMAKGLFNISNDEMIDSFKEPFKIGVSDWFGKDIKNKLINMSDEEYINECNKIIT